MKISIITVCYNAENTIKDTIESVLNQTYSDFEYIIQDGKSTDHTLDIIYSYKDRFKERGIPYIVVSEKDGGIYNAMNKATKIAKGEWVEYMNADDSFYSETVLEAIFGPDNLKGIDAVYGAYSRHDNKKSYVFQSEDIDIMPQKMPFVHQTVFLRLSTFKEYMYDEEYRLCADYDAFFKMYADGKVFKQSSIVIANYSIGGVSGTANIKALKETISIREKHSAKYKITFKDRMRWKYMYCVMIIKKFIPEEVLCVARNIKAYIRVEMLHKTTT